MRCPKCNQTLIMYEKYYNQSFVCESCEYVLPRGAD